MPATLLQIIAETRARINHAKRSVPLADLAEQAERHPRSVRRFCRALQSAAETGIAVIAELKKASPSRGVIRATFPVGALASQLAAGGAAALSVLTEEPHFQGSLQNLRDAAAATGLPCLRKDFIVDEYQLFEAVASSASAVLLIAAALDDAELGKLHRRAVELKLDVLCEVHDETELERVIAVGADIIGVNCRDLKTLAVDPATHFRLAAKMPPHVLRVAESGIGSPTDIRRLRAAGFQAFLIGESLMREPQPGAALAQLISGALAPASGAAGNHD
jgi:indole-3-glycerol phosphate synthase